MIFIDNYPNLERSLTHIEAIMITEKEYLWLNKISRNIKEQIEKELKIKIHSYDCVKKYLEHNEKTLNLTNISTLKKEIIIANVLLPDSTKIVDVLLKNDFTYERLKSIMRFRALIKNIILNDSPTTKELEDKFIVYKQIINKLTEIFEKEFNVTNKTVILNRICELLTRYPHYFETQTKSYTRKR